MATSAMGQVRRCRSYLHRDVLPHLSDADIAADQRLTARIERRVVFDSTMAVDVAEALAAIGRTIEARTGLVPIHRRQVRDTSAALDRIERRLRPESNRLVVVRRELERVAELLEQVLDAKSAEAALAALRAKR